MVEAEGVAWAMMSEGGMYIHVAKVKKSVVSYGLRPKIEIHNSELEYIQVLREWFSRQGVMTNKSRTRLSKRNAHWKDSFKLTIQSRPGITKILTILQPYFIGKHQKACQVMLEWLSKFPRKSRGLGAINRPNTLSDEARGHLQKTLGQRIAAEKGYILKSMIYHDNLQAIYARYVSTRKYSYQYFKNLWS